MERRGISEIVGQAEANGATCAVYRALRDLICAACAGDIFEGELFTRRASPFSQGLPILPICRKCLPFSLLSDESKSPSLLESLLEADGHKASSQGLDKGEGPTIRTNDGIRQKIEERLGPVLRRMRRAAD